MNSNELRIGNAIYTLVSGIPLLSFVCEISEREVKSRIIGLKKIDTFPENQRQGIPITEGWLIKFGFTFDGDIYKASERIKELSNKDTGVKYQAYFFNTRLNRWMDCQTRVCVDYVHQLQNLYFALTGEELIYNQ